VARIACEGEVVDVGPAAFLPVGDVVDRAQTGRRGASRAGASTVGSDQCKPLIGIGEPATSAEAQRTTGMVEQYENWMSMLGELQCVLEG
jgi:hypothetical protein